MAVIKIAFIEQAMHGNSLIKNANERKKEGSRVLAMHQSSRLQQWVASHGLTQESQLSLQDICLDLTGPEKYLEK